MLSLPSKQILKSQLKKSCCKQVQIKECDTITCPDNSG